MTDNFLSGISDAQGSESDDISDDLPVEIANLGSTNYNFEEFNELDHSIKSKVFKSEFQSDLDSGVGRDRLMRYISRNVDSLDGFDSSDTFDLKLYILDILDSPWGGEIGELEGKEVYSMLDDYIEADGEPDFLQDYEVVVDDTSYC